MLGQRVAGVLWTGQAGDQGCTLEPSRDCGEWIREFAAAKVQDEQADLIPPSLPLPRAPCPALSRSACTAGYLSEVQQIAGPFLVVVPLSTVPNWIREFRKWIPSVNAIVYVGDAQSREVRWTPGLLGRGRFEQPAGWTVPWLAAGWVGVEAQLQAGWLGRQQKTSSSVAAELNRQRAHRCLSAAAHPWLLLIKLPPPCASRPRRCCVRLSGRRGWRLGGSTSLMC